jgi:lathosterol oxidase
MRAEKMAELTHFDFFLWTFLSFTLLYFIFTILGYYFLSHNSKFQKYQQKPYRPGQIKVEIRRSMISILMFALTAIPVCEGLRRGIFHLNYDFSWSVFALEILALFFWNEIHFYTVHRIYHLKPFYKYHVDHHFSQVPSPFSAYSFHWSEGFLLGAVMPFAMFFHDFQFWSLASLPVMSIFMNVLGHSNIDFFPHKTVDSLFSFSKRHSLHHKFPHANYSFFLPYLDRLFGTDKDK